MASIIQKLKSLTEFPSIQTAYIHVYCWIHSIHPCNSTVLLSSFSSNQNSLVVILTRAFYQNCHTSPIFSVYSNFHQNLQILTQDSTNQLKIVDLHILKAINQEFKGLVPQIISWLGLSMIQKKNQKFNKTRSFSTESKEQI